jgi:hypothetical protein
VIFYFEIFEIFKNKFDIRENLLNNFVIGSEDTHLRAVLPVSISQIKDLREKLRYVQLLTIAAIRYNRVRVAHSGLALSWLRKELY